MDKNVFQGDLAQTSVPEILARIWRQENSGFLKIREAEAENVFFFEKGCLAVERATFDGAGFVKSLASLGQIGPADLDRIEALAGLDGKGRVSGLSQTGLFSPFRLWSLIESFAKSELFASFNLSQGDYDFEPAQVPAADIWIRDLPIPGLILEGIRRIWNFEVIEAHLPSSGETVQALPSCPIERERLGAHERYILDASASAASLEAFYGTSDLGETETKRILFALLTLGIIGTHQTKNAKSRSDLSLADMDRLFSAFNDRCSYIGKYISKEIGPVSLSVIEKALDEIKERIDPIFQNCQVKPDGRIELRAGGKKSLSVLGDSGRRSLLQSFDEILAAEVLAVKRTLGNTHEAALIRGLEKIGDVA